MTEQLPNGKAAPYFITVKEAANIIKMTPRWLYEKIRDQAGPPVAYFYNGKGRRRQIRIRTSDFYQWADGRVEAPEGDK